MLIAVAGNGHARFVRGRYSTTDEQIETLEKELECVRKQAKFDKETAETARTTLRQSQYRVISELQV